MSDKKEKDFKRLDRMLSILNLLEHCDFINPKDLAEHYGVSLRTLQRDLEQLQKAGFALQELERGEYCFEDGFSLNKISLNDEEISLMTFMDSLIRSMGLPFENAYKSLYAKCLNEDYDSSFYAKLPQTVKAKNSYSFVGDLDAAIDANLKVEVTYAKSKKTRMVSPLKIAYFEGFWYLLAKDDSRDKIITFRLDNINSVKSSSNYFTLDDDVEAILEESVNVWFSGQRDKEILISVNPTVAHYFRARNYFPLQEIVEEKKDGALILSTKVSDYREITTIVFSWLPNLTVIKPQELVTQLKGQVEEYLHLLV